MTRENDVFAFQNIAITTRETRGKSRRKGLSAVLQLHYARSIKPHNIETMDCRLWTADCGQRIQSPRLREKNSSAHISIFQRFLKFPVAKREMSNSSSLNLALPCCACQAWPLRGWGRGGGAEIPFESDDGNVRRLLRGRNCRFWVFNIFTHMGISYGCA